MRLFKRRLGRTAPPPLFVTEDKDLGTYSAGALLAAALNVDILYTAAVEGGRLSANDRAYLHDQNQRLDAELKRRGLDPYGPLEDDR